jgi:hypothetical protein
MTYVTDGYFAVGYATAGTAPAGNYVTDGYFAVGYATAGVGSVPMQLTITGLAPSVFRSARKTPESRVWEWPEDNRSYMVPPGRMQ